MTWIDPIVAEVRQTREALAAKFNFDVDAIFADLRARQSGKRLVRLPSPEEADSQNCIESVPETVRN